MPQNNVAEGVREEHEQVGERRAGDPVHAHQHDQRGDHRECPASDPAARARDHTDPREGIAERDEDRVADADADEDLEGNDHRLPVVAENSRQEHGRQQQVGGKSGNSAVAVRRVIRSIRSTIRSRSVVCAVAGKIDLADLPGEVGQRRERERERKRVETELDGAARVSDDDGVRTERDEVGRGQQEEPDRRRGELGPRSRGGAANSACIGRTATIQASSGKQQRRGQLADDESPDTSAGRGDDRGQRSNEHRGRVDARLQLELQ